MYNIVGRFNEAIHVEYLDHIVTHTHIHISMYNVHTVKCIDLYNSDSNIHVYL